MAGKGKASPRAGTHHGERKRKRRATASVKKDPTYLPTPSTSPSQVSSPPYRSKSRPSRFPRSSTSPSPDSIFAAMVERSHSLPRKWSGEKLGIDLASQTSFLEAVATDEAFFGGNNIAEITLTLKIARECLNNNATGPGVSRDLFKRAKALFEARKAKYIPNLSQMLAALAKGAMLPMPLSYNDTISWYSEIETLLHNTHDYAYEHDLKAKWDKAATNIRKKFDEGMRTLQSQGDANEHGHPNTVQTSTPRQSASSLQELPCSMELLQGPRNTTKAQEILGYLIAYYKRQMAKKTKTETSEIFRDLHTIKLCISKWFSDSKELKMTLQQILGKDKIQAYHDWRLQFEALWTNPAITAMQQRFQGLNKVTHGQPLGRAELIFFEFSKDLDSLAMLSDCSENASQEEWNYLAPRLVSEASAAKAASDLEQKYLAFQDQAYAGAELTRLWLLVWRTLKATQFPLPKESAEVLYPGQESKMSQLDHFAVERAFFESNGQPSSNQISLSTFVQRGDVNNPHWIEGFVSKYCDHVAVCHNEKEKYYWQFSTIGAKVVPTIVVTTLQASNRQSTPHPDRNILLHRIVLRLNHLLGDQKVLKRWWRDKKTRSLAYLDVTRSSTGVTERGQGQTTSGAATTDRGRSDQDSVSDASNRPTGRSTLRGTTGGAAGNGGQDGDGSGDRNDGNRDNHSRNSELSSSGSSSNDPSQENQTPPGGTVPLLTGTDYDTFVRNSTSSRSPQMPHPRPADDQAAANNTQMVLDSFGNDSVPVNPTAPSVGPDSNQWNTIPPVDARFLPTRDLPSALPWIQYPLGETRASERAQSMQIARELRQRGLATSGPHVEDVQNIVPGPLRLVPRPEDDVFQAMQASPRNLQYQSIVGRAVGAIRGLIRPLPSVRPEPLPTLPPRRSPRRPTPSLLTANGDGTSGVRRARDRALRSPGSRSSNRAFTPRRAWIRHVAQFFPWDDPNQPTDPRPRPKDVGNLPYGAMGEPAGASAAPRDTSAGPSAQSSKVFVDRNTIRQPISPTPHGRGAPTQDTSRNITAATVQGNLDLGASPPRVVTHPGPGPLVGAGPEGDERNGIPPWQWIPHANENYQAFLQDDRERVDRRDPARLGAHGVLDGLIGMNVGDAIMMDMYQILRARYEWGLTHTYQFPQHVPGYPRPPVPVGAFPRLHGGVGTAPEQTADNQQGWPEAGEMYRGASVDRDSRPDSNLLDRANVPRSWGSWNGGANRGNQDFDLYASPSNADAQPDADQPESQTCLEERRNPLQERDVRNDAGSRSSISTLNLRSPINAERHTHGGRIVISGHNGSGSRQGVLGTNDAGGRRDSSGSTLGRRNSGGSSLGRRSSPVDLVAGSGNSSQSTPWSSSSRVNRSPTPESPNHQDAGTQTTADRLNFTNVQVVGTPLTGSTSRGGQGSDSQSGGSRSSGRHGSGSQGSGSHSGGSQSSGNQGSTGQGSGNQDDVDQADDDQADDDQADDDQGTGSQGSGRQPIAGQGTGARAPPSRAQYENMTVRQLRDEIRARGGNPSSDRQRKTDLVQMLLDYDNDGNYGNGAQPRRMSTAIPPHPTLSPRQMRPRDGSGRVTRS